MWKTLKGFSSKGVKSAHVTLLHPGQGKSAVGTFSTTKCLPGDNPYALSYPEISKDFSLRKRSINKEYGTVFQSTSRQSGPLDDKVKCKSLRLFENLDRANTISQSKI